MARGNRREAIFLDDDDRRFFLNCLSEACEKTGWLVHAWVLMGNHYHLFLEIAANVSLAINRSDWKKLETRAPAALNQFVQKMQEYAH